MPWDGESFGVPSKIRKIVAFLDVYVGTESVRSAEPEEEGAIVLKRMLPDSLFENMSPRSTIPESSGCMAIFVRNFSRRKAQLPV